MFLERPGERLAVEDVALDEGRPLNHRLAVALAEVIEDDHLVAAQRELLGDHAADVARAARHQNAHASPSSCHGACPRPRPSARSAMYRESDSSSAESKR